MIIEIQIPNLFHYWRKFTWFMNDQCSDCGGRVSGHINGKFYCDDCDKLN